MYEMGLNNIKKYTILILLFLLVISCFYFVDSSNGAETNGNDGSSNGFNDNNKILVNNSSKNNGLSLSHGTYRFNESSNVVLEFTIGPSNVIRNCGNGLLFFNITLSYKENKMPLANQRVHLIVGNSTSSFITDANGMICNMEYHPNIYGDVTFKVLFNGSRILRNDSMISLEPVSVNMKYFLRETLHHNVPSGKPRHNVPSGNDTKEDNSPIHSNDPYNNFDDFEPSLNNTKAFKNDDSKVAYGEMKNTGLPLIQLLLSLIVVLGLLVCKK